MEDVALLAMPIAILTLPGAVTRKGEVAFMKATLESRFEKVYELQEPCNLEAGDVMQIGKHFFIGLSDRTNLEGAEQVIRWLSEAGYTGSVVEMKDMLHLKTGVNALSDDYLLVAGEFIGHPEFNKYQQIIIPDEEAYAANSLMVNDVVIVPDGHPKTIVLLEQHGFKVVVTPVSEFQKVDGGLSCLSLRY